MNITPEIWTFIILGAAMVAFSSSKAPMAVVASGVAVALWATGVLSMTDAFAGFGNPTVIFIASLFIVIEALNSSGINAWLAQLVTSKAKGSRTRIILVIGVAAAVLGAFLSVSGTVGALLPVVVVATFRAGLLPSKMLIPLAFLASGGSVLTLTASPVNIVVSQAAATAGGREFTYFEFALVGAPLVVITILIVLFAGDKLLPARQAQVLPMPDLATHAETLRANYHVDLSTKALFTTSEGVAEVLVAPRSSLIGQTVSPGMLTATEELVILAARRGDDPGSVVREVEGVDGRLELRAGDAILLQGAWDALDRYTSTPDVIAVAQPQSFQRAVPLGRGAKRTLVVFALMVVLLSTGIVPTAIATLLAAGALILTRVVTIPTVYRAVPWSVVILVGGMIPLSTAFVSTGAAKTISNFVLSIIDPGSPRLALLAICVLAMLLGQFMSNLATVLIVMPIAIAISQAAEVSPQPFMMALAICGAASFLTPIATPGNLIVLKPGGYKFGDYWRLGLPLMIVYLIVAIFYVPVIWPF